MSEEQANSLIVKDNWSALKQYTAARIALGRTGISVPAKEMLQFKMAHAHARDAVYSVMNKEYLIEELKQFHLPVINLKSMAANRLEYLQRPDLGRKLSEESLVALQVYGGCPSDVSIIIADGLSAEAINKNAICLLNELMPKLTAHNSILAPFCVAEQARVAIGDEIGFTLHASVVILLIGERPGLSAADSLGVYITHEPQVGLTDERRKCVSNIREGGLTPAKASTIIYNVVQSLNGNILPSY